MNPQDQLFHEDFRDALRHAVKAMGGYEAVGADIWPGKTRKAAGNWLSDCLNAERAAKLDIEELLELLRMARQRGQHCAVYQAMDEIGYERPNIAPEKTEEQILVEQFQRQAQELRRLADEIASKQRGTRPMAVVRKA